MALLLVHRRDASRVALAILIAVSLFVGAQLAFRVAYYDDYLPNTAYAKVVLSERRLEEGFNYFVRSLMPLAATWASLAAVAVYGVWRKSTRPQATVVSCLAALWTVYVVRVGGDNFPAWRQWSFLVVLAALGVTAIARDDVRRGRAPRWLGLGVALTGLAAAGSYWDTGNWAKAEVWQWDGRPVGLTLKRGFAGQQPLIAVDASGTIPFYSELPALDMLGLTDRYLAHHRPKNMGASLIGHELGDENYYLRRKPDIFCFGVPPCTHAAKFPPQHRMLKKQEFRKNYVPVRFLVRRGRRPLVSELWVNREGAIGIRRESGFVRIPPCVLATDKKSKVELDRNGDFHLRLPPGTTARIALNLSAGHWTLTAGTLEGAGRLEVNRRLVSVASGPAEAPLEFSLDHATMIGLVIRAGDAQMRVKSMELRAR